MKNRTIIWYTIKYSVVILLTLKFWEYAGKLGTSKNDVENALGFAILIGLLLGWVLLLKHDLNKLGNFLSDKLKNKNK